MNRHPELRAIAAKRTFVGVSCGIQRDAGTQRPRIVTERATVLQADPVTTRLGNGAAGNLHHKRPCHIPDAVLGELTLTGEVDARSLSTFSADACSVSMP